MELPQEAKKRYNALILKAKDKEEARLYRGTVAGSRRGV
jgi:hypothetical protein